jgi:hypothetical protein
MSTLPFYQPFPGGSGTWNLQAGVRRRLYYADTHFLLIENIGFTESYSRIYYKEIRYMVTAPTYRQEIIGAIYGLILLACLGAFLALLKFSFAILVPGVIAIPFLILFIINLVQGAGCACYLATGIQTVRIPMPNRYKDIPRLIDFLSQHGVQNAVFN